MPGKARVSAIAKELGVPSKDVLAKLTELGEYVKSPSSTVEAPVVRRLHEAFPTPAPKAAKAAKATKAAKPVAASVSAPAVLEPATVPAPAEDRAPAPARA
ncbi:MAG: translation initiation factor IF-2 N-terminal domain-containing protein, partial [Actinomycetota bacterium]|nr:translation initiation factor IF-2 N-terminal domain-containing protein [Actinomycetota bacterium]